MVRFNLAAALMAIIVLLVGAIRRLEPLRQRRWQPGAAVAQRQGGRAYHKWVGAHHATGAARLRLRCRLLRALPTS